MKKLTILVDMDDTIECLTRAWVTYLNWRHGTNVSWRDIRSWDMRKAFPSLSEEEVYAPLCIDWFWDTVKPMKDAITGVKRLIDAGNDVYIVTASTYVTLKAKMEKVLFRYFPYLSWDQVIVTSRKQMVRGDVLIDDAPHNLEGFDGMRILMDAPHNRGYKAWDNGMLRVNHWDEICGVLLKEEKAEEKDEQKE